MRVLITAFTFVLFLSCASESKSERLEGEFIYYADAAVLKCDSDVYGVVLDEKANELINQAAGYKKQPEDFVQVILEVIKIPKSPETEGWDTLVKVKKILAVSYPKETEELYRIQKQDNKNRLY